MDLKTIVENIDISKRRKKSIKSLKPNPKTMFKDGYYPIDKCKKYISIDDEPCIYRSSLEFKTFFWCENNKNVKAWTSEPFSIPYLLRDEKTGNMKNRNYNIDCIIEFHDGRLWFVEIKPHALTKMGSYCFEQNKAKWNYAIMWCAEQDYKIDFKIITEKFNFYI